MVVVLCKEVMCYSDPDARGDNGRVIYRVSHVITLCQLIDTPLFAFSCWSGTVEAIWSLGVPRWAWRRNRNVLQLMHTRTKISVFCPAQVWNNRSQQEAHKYAAHPSVLIQSVGIGC